MAKLAIVLNKKGGSVSSKLVNKVLGIGKKYAIKIYDPYIDNNYAQKITDSNFSVIATVGGDGTLRQTRRDMANSFRAIGRNPDSIIMAPVKGGTGNALSGLSGAKNVTNDLEKLIDLDYIPTLSNPLLDITYTTFAGTQGFGQYTFAGVGVDAQIVSDKEEFCERNKRRFYTRGLFGYTWSIFTKTLWKELKGNGLVKKIHYENSQPTLLNSQGNHLHSLSSENLFDEIECQPQNVMSIMFGTTPTFGFGLKALPYASQAAERGNMMVRIVKRNPFRIIGRFLRQPGKFWNEGYVPGYTVDLETPQLSLEMDTSVAGQIAGTPIGKVTKYSVKVSSETLTTVNFSEL